MKSFTKELRRQAENQYWGRGNQENPRCSNCDEVMDFFGDDETPLGEGYWECPVCKENSKEKQDI